MSGEGGVRLQRPLRVYVLDTSAVSDPRLRGVLGAGGFDDAVRGLAELIARARVFYGVEIYMPPSVYEEARRFLLANRVTLQSFEMLATWITVKPPTRHEIRVPAQVLREIVDVYRQRITRGLRVAEEHVRRAFEAGARLGEAADQQARRERLGAIVRGLREKFRESTRHGIVDSIEDIDAVLLAYELHGVLVTNDEGVKRLAEALGVVVLDPVRFVNTLKALLSLAAAEQAAGGEGEEGEHAAAAVEAAAGGGGEE